jgi:hypothetical protein
MPHSRADLDASAYAVEDPAAFVAAALSLPEARHFAVVGYGRLHRWLSGLARTREPLFDDYAWPQGVVFQCRLDVVARDGVRRLLLKAEDDICKRGIVTVHHWWLYSDDQPLLACWDWQHCGEPIQIAASLRPWMAGLLEAGIVTELEAESA